MLNIRFGLKYLLHQLTANNRHGLHSPFVYQLVDEVIYDFSEKKVYHRIKEILKRLLNDNNINTVTNLDANACAKNYQRKSLRAIAKGTLKSPELMQLIYRLATDGQPETIIALGTSSGIATLYLQAAAPNARIYTTDGSPHTGDLAVITEITNAGNMEQLISSFNDNPPPALNSLPQLDFVYVDGNRQKDVALRYFEWCLPKVQPNTLLIFNDIYYNEGMKEAWEIIKAHQKVTVTIDLFWIGLVYFKKGQAKENFKVKF